MKKPAPNTQSPQYLPVGFAALRCGLLAVSPSLRDFLLANCDLSEGDTLLFMLLCAPVTPSRASFEVCESSRAAMLRAAC